MKVLKTITYKSRDDVESYNSKVPLLKDCDVGNFPIRITQQGLAEIPITGLWILSNGNISIDQGDVTHALHAVEKEFGDITMSDVDNGFIYNPCYEVQENLCGVYPMARIVFDNKDELKRFVNRYQAQANKTLFFKLLLETYACN